MGDRSPRTLHVHHATPNAAGAVAVLELWGDASKLGEVLSGLTGGKALPIGRLVYADLGGVDDGLVVRLSETRAQVMPHGGVRVVQRLMQGFVEQGAEVPEPEERVDPWTLYPEARDAVEARALALIGRGVSPAAVDGLLRQSELWAGFHPREAERKALWERAEVLGHLVVPPRVVVVGRPNAGKSTLLNRLLGRAQNLTSDLPGTTRDHTQSLVMLNHSLGGIAVRWLDTPGLRETDDAVEARAIELTRRVLREADVLIALASHDADWPDAEALPRKPDLRVWNKADQAPAPEGVACDAWISAGTGEGLGSLEHAVLKTLGLADLCRDEHWAQVGLG